MKTKKLQLITVSLFILTILTLIIGIILIALYHGIENVKFKNLYFNNLIFNKPFVIIKYNGFDLLIKYNLIYILSHKIIYFKEFGSHFKIQNFEIGSLIQLKIGTIFCEILTPILTLIIIILIISIKILKKTKPNNNFWDAIQNCEIINNYYIH